MISGEQKVDAVRIKLPPLKPQKTQHEKEPAVRQRSKNLAANVDYTHFLKKQATQVRDNSDYDSLLEDQSLNYKSIKKQSTIASHDQHKFQSKALVGGQPDLEVLESAASDEHTPNENML